MKKSILYSAAIACLSLTSCDMNEEPKSSASIPMVFSSEKGLQTYAYSFYNELPSITNAFKQETTIDYGAKNSNSGMEVGAYTTNSETSWSWTALRNINFFLEKNTDETVSATIRENYNGIAKFFRAWFYYAKLKKYGGVPWVDRVFNDPDDPGLFAPRDTRDVIIRHIIEDLDYAYEHITESKPTINSSIVNRWAALAFKTRVCLYEASWRRYHANDELNIARTGCTEYSAEDLYRLAAEAAKELIDKGPYSIYTGKEYANGRGSYRELFIADEAVTSEVILATVCDAELALGEQNWWYNSSTYGSHLSMSRKFMNTYLNIDGTPYSDRHEDGSYKTFKEDTEGRDLRLNQTIRGIDYTCKNANGIYVKTFPDFLNLTLTGYQFTKYVMDDVSYDNHSGNDNDMPLIRFAEVLLNYAEAMAELNQLTDSDWAMTIGKLRARAGITGGTPQTGTLDTRPTVADPYMAAYYPGLTNPVLLEIRREREIELCLEGLRLSDLRRWNACQLWVDDPWEGMYIPALNTPIDLDEDGTPDVYFYDTDSVDPNYASISLYVGNNKNNILNVKKVDDGGYLMVYNYEGREWPVRQYIYPLPEVVIQKNPNLEQNPGW